MIRNFEDRDLEAVCRIWLNTNCRAHGFIPADYWKSKFELVKALLPQAEILVWEENDEKKIRGFLGISGDWIEGIFVEDTWQSRGIGKQLIDAAKKRKDRLVLSVYEKNARARRFYEREGFVVRGRGIDEETKEEEWTMEWKAELSCRNGK